MKKASFNYPSVFYIVLIALLSLSLNTAIAQTAPPMPYEKEPAASAEEKAVRQVIDAMFDGMRAGDGDKVASLFVDGVVAQRAGTDREGKPRLGNTPISDFAAAVNKPHDQVWDEQVWNVDIKIDGRLASAWMNFVFYLGDSFSHCGVNSFQFFKDDDGWKIISLADTSQRTGCEIPEHIKPAGN
ncbi:MAG: nuclear transport factor 2 family protein [Rhodothermales bacterium]